VALLQVISISKSFDHTPVLRDVSFHVDQGEIVCMLAQRMRQDDVLRIVAGLEKADAGDVIFDERPMLGVPVHRRGLG